MPARDAAVARFVERHAADRRSSAFHDAAAWAGTTAEQRLVQLVSLCRLTAALALAGRAPERALSHQEPPSPGWAQLARRHRRASR